MHLRVLWQGVIWVHDRVQHFSLKSLVIVPECQNYSHDE